VSGAEWLGILVAVVVLYVLPVWVCVARGPERGRDGWPWGLLLGWFGVLMIFLLPPGEVAEVDPQATDDEADAVERYAQWKQDHSRRPRTGAR
jgi:hypothetical protein